MIKKTWEYSSGTVIPLDLLDRCIQSAAEERAISVATKEEGKAREIGSDRMVENGDVGSRVGRIRFLVLLIYARGTGPWAGYPIFWILHHLLENMICDVHP